MIAIITLGIGYDAIAGVNLLVNGSATLKSNDRNFLVRFVKPIASETAIENTIIISGHNADETLEDLMDSTSVQVSYVSSYVNKLLDVMEKLDMKSRISFRDNYLNPALENGLIKMTNPDKPTSKNQMYYKV